ncbi:hypothetical protein ABMY21_22410, partial [Vibrio vulnificus]
NFIGLHLKTEINEALVTNSKHHRSPYISTTFMRFPCIANPLHIKKLSGALGNKAKNDRLDAALIAHYAEAIKPKLTQLKSEN